MSHFKSDMIAWFFSHRHAPSIPSTQSFSKTVDLRTRCGCIFANFSVDLIAVGIVGLDCGNVLFTG